MNKTLLRKTLATLVVPMMALATVKAQTYTVTGNVSAGAGFFDAYTDVVNTSEYTLTLTANTALNGKNVTIGGVGNGNGALNFTQSSSSSTTANITLSGDSTIRWNQFANLTISNAINESTEGSRLTLLASEPVNTSFNGRAYYLQGAQNYTGGLTVDKAKVVLQANSGNMPSGEIRLINFGGFDIAYGNRDFTGKLVIDNGFVYRSGGGTAYLAAQGGYEVREGQIHSSARLSGNGSLLKVGSEVFSLNGSNDYTGTTTVSEGTLNVNGSLTSAGITVTVHTPGTLSGSGHINRPTNIFGQHNPGDGVGIQSIGANGNLSYQNGSVVNWELIANTDADRGASYDGVNFNGSANLYVFGTSTINLNFDGEGSTVDWSDAFWDEDHSWLLYDLTDGTIGGGGSFVLGAISADSLGAELSSLREYAEFSIGTVGNDVYLNYYTVIPEPRTIALTLGLMAFLAVSVLRRNGKK